MTVLAATPTAPWRFFDAAVVRVVGLGPSLVRVTLAGPDLDAFADNGFDQRFKLLLPVPGRGYADLPRGEDWYATWRRLPDDRRNPLRTYTVRRLRPEIGELDVDMVLHGTTGPASAFAAGARPGDEVVLLGPNAAYDGPHGGLEFRPPPAHRGPFLLAGDETALPAIAGILEQLPADAHGEVVLEVPEAGDRLPLAHPDGIRLTWVVRGDAPYGDGLVAAVRTAVAVLDLPRSLDGQEVDETDEEALWDVPDEAAAVARSPYAWLAGESAAIRTLRRHLVADIGVDKRAVAFMGYWRDGVAGS